MIMCYTTVVFVSRPAQIAYKLFPPRFTALPHFNNLVLTVDLTVKH